MQTRSFNIEQDYDTVATWWTKQGWPALPKSILQCKGFVVEENNKALAATWIFATGCPVYIMEWTVGNPDVSWEIRDPAIKMVTDSACNWAKEDGASQVFTMTKHDRLIGKLEEYGFMKTDSGMTHLVRSL